VKRRGAEVAEKSAKGEDGKRHWVLAREAEVAQRLLFLNEERLNEERRTSSSLIPSHLRSSAVKKHNGSDQHHGGRADTTPLPLIFVNFVFFVVFVVFLLAGSRTFSNF
jgi:hypothetical protein